MITDQFYFGPEDGDIIVEPKKPKKKPSNNILREAVFPLYLSKYDVRFWVQIREGETYKDTNIEISDIINKMNWKNIDTNDAEDIASNLIKIANVSAVEVKCKYTSVGCVFYKDWP